MDYCRLYELSKLKNTGSQCGTEVYFKTYRGYNYNLHAFAYFESYIFKI